MAFPALAALLVVLAGCTSPGPQHPGGAEGPAPGTGDVQQEQDFFRRSVEASAYTKEENYFSVFSSQRVALRGSIDARAGSVWVYLMDGSARLWVFNKTFQGPLQRSLEFVSDAGDPGTWMVSLCFQGFTGSLTLELTPTQAGGQSGDPWRGGACR